MDTSLYVIFLLNNEQYGISISYAQEIIRIPDIMTQLPNMPDYIEGVINLRGKVIPVIDLKKRFQTEQTERTTDSRLLIINVNNSIQALIVDDVSDIIFIKEKYIEKLTPVISKIGQHSLDGVAIIEQQMILLLNATRLENDIFEFYLEMEEVK